MKKCFFKPVKPAKPAIAVSGLAAFAAFAALEKHFFSALGRTAEEPKVKRTKRNILIEFVGQRLLTDAEANTVRELAVSFKPRVHLIKGDWPYCEIRGIRDEAAAKVLDVLSEMGPRFREL